MLLSRETISAVERIALGLSANPSELSNSRRTVGLVAITKASTVKSERYRQTPVDQNAELSRTIFIEQRQEQTEFFERQDFFQKI